LTAGRKSGSLKGENTMARRFWTVLFLALLVSGTWADGWLDDFEAAKKAAAASGKPILVDATGSDWCPPCQQMEAEVFSRPDFQATVGGSFVLLRLDYPRNRTQSERLRVQNKLLADKLGLTAFPTYFLLDAQGVPYGRHEGYVPGGVAGFAAMTTDLAGHKAVLGALSDAVQKAAAGGARAQALDALFRQAEAWGLAAQDGDLPMKIIQEDKDGAANLKPRYQVYNAYSRLLATWAQTDDFHTTVTELDQLAARAAPWADLQQRILFTKGMIWLNALDDEMRARDAFRQVRALGAGTPAGLRAAELLDQLP
jgi:thioredoxin-related protein